MAAPNSTVLAMLGQKCPRCHQGNMFTHGMYNLAHYTEMPLACPVCGLAFEPEPGFYIGAMYISYAAALVATASERGTTEQLSQP